MKILIYAQKRDVMDYIQAIVLGIIQGITEWLPISSEAMVTLAGRFLFGEEYKEALGNAIWLHGGTLIAVLVYFYKDIIEILKMKEKELLVFLVITTVLSAIIAAPLLLLAFSLEIPDYLFTIIIGIFLVVVAFLQKNRKEGKQNIKPKTAILPGIVQGLAALPGFSRSGLTIAVLLAEKFSLKDSFRLSFLMSIPVIAGAQLALPLLKEGFEITLPMIVGSLTAAIVGFLTIKLLMEFAEKINFFKATLTLGLMVIALGLVLMV